MTLRLIDNFILILLEHFLNTSAEWQKEKNRFRQKEKTWFHLKKQKKDDIPKEIRTPNLERPEKNLSVIFNNV